MQPGGLGVSLSEHGWKYLVRTEVVNLNIWMTKKWIHAAGVLNKAVLMLIMMLMSFPLLLALGGC